MGKSDMYGEPLRLVTCGECTTVFQPRAPELERLAEWYEYMGHHPANYETTPLIERRLARLVDALEPFRSSDRLLEVGAGGGGFARVATARGWNVYATEISPSCAERLRKTHGERLFEGDLADVPFEPGTFDVVVMMEVVEHLSDPASYLRAAWRLLHPDGCVFLTTPNLRGVSGRHWGYRWHIISEEHLTYFDSRSIEKLLTTAGFSKPRLLTTGIDLTTARQWFRSRTLPADPLAPQPGAPLRAPTWWGTARAGILDTAIELANGMLTYARLGDTLKVFAHKVNPKEEPQSMRDASPLRRVDEEKGPQGSVK